MQNHLVKNKILFLFIAFISGCGSISRSTSHNLAPENNKDVFILAKLIQNHLIETPEIELNLNELVLDDSLKRISNSFEAIEVQYRGGYIDVFYRFSNNRNANQIDLNEKELKETNYLKWIVKNIKEPYDGEIQFQYGERFYGIRKIITK